MLLLLLLKDLSNLSAATAQGGCSSKLGWCIQLVGDCHLHATAVSSLLRVVEFGSSRHILLDELASNCVQPKWYLL